MRTTVRLDDGLLALAKKHAAETNRTLTALIEDALRMVLARQQRPRPSERITLKIRASAAGAALADARVVDVEIKTRPVSREEKEIERRLGIVFHPKAGAGLVVRSVALGSPREKVGHAPGDLLVKMGRRHATFYGNVVQMQVIRSMAELS